MSINQAQIFGPVRAGLAGSMDRDILIISTRVGSDPGGRDHQLKGGAGVTEPVAFRHNSSPASLRSFVCPPQFSLISDLTQERENPQGQECGRDLHKFGDDLRHILVCSCLGISDGLTDLELEYTTVPDFVFARTRDRSGRQKMTQIL